MMEYENKKRKEVEENIKKENDIKAEDKDKKKIK